MDNLPNIDYKKPSKNPTLDSDTSFYALPYYKDIEYFANLDNFVSFVKSVEQMVRTSKYYARYIKYLKKDIGLNFCQVLSNIKIDEDDEKANTKIEMHHGPILTLFDYISIVVDHRLAHEQKVNSFIIADIIIDEHFNNNVQVVMLSKTVHELVHDNSIFINTKQAFGDLNAFLKKYKDGINDEQVHKINNYIQLSKKYVSFDKHVLDLEKNIVKWTS